MLLAARAFVIIAALLSLVAYVFSLSPIPQPDAYHRFADARTFLGIPNALNVLSNLPFAVVGPLGLATVMAAPRESSTLFRDPWERWPWAVLFAGIALTAFGSAWYHVAPENARLVWDRIPMTFGFMGFVTALVAERVSVRMSRVMLGPVLLLGVGSVVYWYWSELGGQGDLRPYVIVQFGSLLSAFLLIVLYPARDSGTGFLLLALGVYAGAKGLEDADERIFAMGQIVSGHTLKHLAAAGAVGSIVAMIRARRARGDHAEPVRGARTRTALMLTGAGFLWATVYSLVWGIAWITFMRTAWYEAAGADRPMPWTEIWTVWAVLNIPLGLAIAAYLHGRNREAARSTELVTIVLVLWIPMTLGMFGWAWFDSFSLGVIAVDSVVNLVGLAAASLAARWAISKARPDLHRPGQA